VFLSELLHPGSNHRARTHILATVQPVSTRIPSGRSPGSRENLLLVRDCYVRLAIAPFDPPGRNIRCGSALNRHTEHKEKTMKYSIMLIGLVLMTSAGKLAFAEPVTGGQYPAPPGLASGSALSECGFAAVESWGPNGFQYCDARNVYPRR
jgi:hypothetical protein